LLKILYNRIQFISRLLGLTPLSLRFNL